MSYHDSHRCNFCGEWLDPLQLCGCPQAVARHVRERTSLHYVADALELAAKEIARLKTELASKTDPCWQPITTAPRDGTPVWVCYDHDADPGTVDDGKTLTPYAAHVDAVSCKRGRGQCVAVFGHAYAEDVSGEGWGPFIHIPDWWFEADSEGEVAVNPTHWMPMPPAPEG